MQHSRLLEGGGLVLFALCLKPWVISSWCIFCYSFPQYYQVELHVVKTNSFYQFLFLIKRREIAVPLALIYSSQTRQGELMPKYLSQVAGDKLQST